MTETYLRNTEEERKKGTSGYRSRNILNKIISEAGKIDVEVLLINSMKIIALKVQEVSDNYLRDKPYISLFCFSEIKVDCVDFTPVGIKIITKHRKKGEKKGGGLAIGHLINEKIKLEETKNESSDILIVEGAIH